MSALDPGAGAGANTTRRFTTTSTRALNPTSGWCAGIWYRAAASFGSAEVLFGFGANGGANSFQLRTYSSAEIGVNARDGSGINETARVAYPAAGDYLLVAQYSTADGSLRFYRIAKGSTVTGSSDSTGIAYGTITPASGWYVFGDGTDWAKNPAGEAFLINRRLTNAELTLLASGKQPAAVTPPQIHLPFRNGAGATEVNQGSDGSAADATRVGTGYTTTTDFFGLRRRTAELLLGF